MIPKNFTVAEIDELIEAKKYIFSGKPYPLKIFSDEIKKFIGKAEWGNGADLVEDLQKITGTNSLEKTEKVLGDWKQEMSEKPVESTVPQNREEQEKERLFREKQKIASKEAAETKQEKWLKLQKEKVLGELKGKVVYAVPEKPEPEIVLTEQEQAFTKLAKQNPRVFEQKLAEDIIKKNPEIFKSEELKPLADIIAAETTGVFIDPTQKPVPTGVFAALAKHKESPEIQRTAVLFTLLSEERQNLYREILNRTVGINLANKILGFPETVYEFSPTPPERPEGSFSIKLDDLQANSFALQESPLFQTFDSPLLHDAKTAVSGQLKDFAFAKIASLPKEGFLGGISRFATSKSFDSVAPFLGLPTQMSYTGTTFFGKMITTFLPEYAPLITNFTAKLGIDIGIKALAPVAGKSIETGIASLAVKGAAGKAVGGVVSKVLTVLGGLASWATFGLSLIGGWLLGKIIEKIPWKKVLPWIVGVPVFVIVGPVAGVAAGLGTFWLLSGLPLKAAGFQIGSFFARIGASMAITIGTPIIVAIVVFPILVAIILFIINSGAYLVPPSGVSGPTENPYVDIVKTVDPQCMNRSGCPGFGTAKYHVKISAKKGPLTNIKLTNEYSLVCKTPGQPIPSPNVPEIKNPPTTISPTQPYEFDYTLGITSVYDNCLIIDTLKAIVDTPDKKGFEAAASASISVGNPPEECPRGWPVDGDYGISQGPRGICTHVFVEAIDLKTPVGINVTARNSGIVRVVYTGGAYRPIYVDIISTCKSQSFYSRYAHLSSVSVVDGQKVTMGQSIGTTGSDGTGPHLHYEFNGLKMAPPYIPKSIPYGCCGSCGTIP